MLRRSAVRRIELPPTDFKPPAYKGSSYDDLWAKRQKYLNPVWFHLYDKPLLFAQGHRQYIWNEKGERYLDLFGGVTTVSVGHSHPRITEAIKDQAPRFHHTTGLYMAEPVLEFCEEFAARLPKSEDWVVHPVNSGSEANDFAMLMARVFTQNYNIIGLRWGYHGFTENTRGMIAVPGWKHNVPPPPGLLRTAVPHPYRGVFGTEDVQPYVDELQSVINCETGGRVAAFLAERIQGVGGAGELLPGYTKKAYDIIKAHGGLYISDEVQCGFGRLGSHYWGFEVDGVVPDIVTTAKSVANGFPVGVVACKREIADAMKGVAYFNTFGGGATSMRAATETLRIIDDEKLQENAVNVGGRLKSGLEKLAEKHSIIGQVRGRGFLQGFELVRDRKTKEPAKEETARYMQLMYEENILVGKGGPYGNVVRLHPPMVITAGDVDAFLEATDKCLAKL